MLDLRRSTGPVLTIAPDSWMRPLLVEDVGSDYIDALNNETVSKFLVSAKSGRYMIVHNIGQGPRMEDIMFNWKVTGHYCYFGPAL